MKPLNPFTTSRRYSVCPDCDKGFDPSSGYEYEGGLPDDCNGVVEHEYCLDCKLNSPPQLSPILLIIGAGLITLGLFFVALLVWVN